MSDDLLAYYNRELTYIRRHASKFAQDHPKIAGRLRMGANTSDDPHVERLIEAFAYLTARIRHKLDDELPEITEALLGVLYPHYQAPIPSMAIVEMELDPAQDQLTTGYTVPRHTEIETEPIQGEPCRFRTCYPVTLWPIELRAAGLTQSLLGAPPLPGTSGAVSVLKLVLHCRAKELDFSALAIRSLRFFLNGQAQEIFRLYELIFNNTIGVAASSDPDTSPILLGKGCLRTVGFERDEGMLPYPARSFLGYRLLTEYFAFPQKFLFLDLAIEDYQALGRAGNRLELYLYLDKRVPDLEQSLSADSFRLGCTPLVNLYRQRAEQFKLTHTEFEYRVVPDVRRPMAHEIYTIDRVTGSPPDGGRVEFHPFFSIKHSRNKESEKTFWHASRRPGGGNATVGDQGSEVFVSLVDLGFKPSSPADWTIEVETTCLNRDLPHRLPFGGGQPHLQMSTGGGIVTRVTCLTPPTRTVRPATREGALWRLISHLSLNHLSLVDDDGQADALREILKLYDFVDSPETRKQIDGILGLDGRRVVGSIRTRGPVSFCRGVEVVVEFDPERFSGSGMFLCACVLERFLALYCTVNSFTKLIAKVKGREEELRRWPPRMGERVLA